MKIIWNGHACFTLETEQGSLVLDPYEDGYVPGLAPLDRTADEVLCSHGHRDHNAATVVRRTGRPCGIDVEAIHTYHDGEKGAKRGENTIYILCAEGMRVAHCGDLGCELEPEQLEQLQGVDALLVPVGGYFTIDAAQAHKLVEQVQPRVVIPMHYRGEDFGFDVLTPVEEFTALCKNVIWYDTNTLELKKGTPSHTAVLAYIRL